MSPYRHVDRARSPEPEDDREESAFVTSIVAIALAVAVFQRSHGGAFDAVETLAWLVAIVLLIERAFRARAAAGSRGTSTRRPPTSTG